MRLTERGRFIIGQWDERGQSSAGGIGTGGQFVLGAADAPSGPQSTEWAVTDGVAFADSLVLARTRLLLFTESLTVGDTLTPSRTLLRAFADSPTLTHTTDARILAWLQWILSDNLVVLDTPTRSMGTIRIDGVTVGDAVRSEANWTFAENAVLTDTIAWFRALRRVFNDTAILGDTFAALRTLNLLVTDGLSLTDGRAQTIAAVNADRLTATDTLGHNLRVQYSDALTMVDTELLNRIRAWLVTETLTLADTLAKEVGVTYMDAVRLAQTFLLGWLEKHKPSTVWTEMAKQNPTWTEHHPRSW